MTDQVNVQSPVALIAGGGALPFAVAASLKSRGIESVILAVRGFCDPARVAAYRHHWVAVGQLGRLVRLMRSEHCRDVIFIGGMIRPSLKEVRLDWQTLRALPEIGAALRGGDDHLLKGVSRLFETRGFRLLGLRDVAPDLLMPEGCMTKSVPDDEAAADIAKGRDVLSAIGPFDVGQGVVVVNGHPVAVEDIEGTDALLARVARLRDIGRLRASPGHGVLVKAPKKGQDLRFDLPALGPRTIEGVAKAGLAGIAIVAGLTVVAEPQTMIEAADRAGIFVIGLKA
jgi:DUF1009 family protein